MLFSRCCSVNIHFVSYNVYIYIYFRIMMLFSKLAPTPLQPVYQCYELGNFHSGPRVAIRFAVESSSMLHHSTQSYLFGVMIH